MLSNLVIASIIGKIFLLSTAIYCYRKQIKLFFFKRRLFLNWMAVPEDDYCIYDIFLIYHEYDKEFVKDNILTTLEKEYKVCEIHRNIGEDRHRGAMEVWKAISESRRTVIIATEEYVKNLIDMGIMRSIFVGLAHGSPMPRLVVVTTIDKAVKDKYLDEGLKRFLESGSTVKWKTNQFWDEFRYALPHQSLVTKN